MRESVSDTVFPPQTGRSYGSDGGVFFFNKCSFGVVMPRGAPKGTRYGGRVKGTPNKATIDVQETLARMGLNPLEGMAKLALDPEASLELRGRMMSELAQYVAPKRKAVEHSGGTEDLLTVEVLKFTAGEK